MTAMGAAGKVTAEWHRVHGPTITVSPVIA
jgi:hypothetical protein